MNIKINYLKKISKNNSNLVFFCDEKYNTKALKKNLHSSDFSYIDDLLKKLDLKKNLLIFEINSKRTIVLISIKNNLKESDIENLGAEFYGKVKSRKDKEYNIISDGINSKNNYFLSYLHGIKLKSYEFKKYKTKKI